MQWLHLERVAERARAPLQRLQLQSLQLQRLPLQWLMLQWLHLERVAERGEALIGPVGVRAGLAQRALHREQRLRRRRPVYDALCTRRRAPRAA